MLVLLLVMVLGLCVGRNLYGVEAGTVVANPLYSTIKKKIMVCRVVGERGQLVARHNALKTRSWADVLGLESGVSAEG